MDVTEGEIKNVLVELVRTVSMTELGYYSGDPHLHFPRQTETDDEVIHDLLEAEDIQFGSVLAYNEPAGSYRGLDGIDGCTQLRGLGKRSVRTRGSTSIASGQEYRQLDVWTHKYLLARFACSRRAKG